MSSNKPKDGKRPSFQFYPADWLADMPLRMLPWASKGLYMDLLCYCWREGWIPADSSAIAQLSGCHDTAIVEPCLKMFQSHPDDPSKLIHKRLLDEKNKQDEHKKERSESGKRGAKAKWDKVKSESNGSANGSAINQPMAKNGSSSSSSSSSDTITNRNSINTSTQLSWDAGAGFVGVDFEFLEQMAKAYPNANIKREIDAMHEWLLSNPRKAKKKNWRQFITTWLNKVQAKAGSNQFIKPDERMARIGAIIGRTEEDLWSQEEVELFNNITQITVGQVKLLSSYYGATIPKSEDFRCKSLGSLLKNWSRELDKARTWQADQKGAME